MYFRGGRAKRALLNLCPRDIVERKRRDDAAITRDVDRLPRDCDKGCDTAEFIAARREKLRSAALVECRVTRTGNGGMFDEDDGVLRIKLLQCERHNQQVGGREVSVLDEAGGGFLGDFNGQQNRALPRQ